MIYDWFLSIDLAALDDHNRNQALLAGANLSPRVNQVKVTAFQLQ
jgi:hypothetical protein